MSISVTVCDYEALAVNPFSPNLHHSLSSAQMFIYNGELTQDALIRWALEEYGVHLGVPVPPLPTLFGLIEKQLTGASEASGGGWGRVGAGACQGCGCCGSQTAVADASIALLS